MGNSEIPDRPVEVPALDESAVAVYGDGLTADVWAVLEGLRRRFGAIAPVEVAPGVRAWVLLSYELNRQVLQDDRRFARDPRRWREAREGRASPREVPGPFWYFRNALASDEPDHSRYRRVVVEALAGITAAGTRLAVRESARDLLAGVAAQGRCDLVSDYAFRLPLLLLSSFFGLSDAQGRELVAVMRRVWDGGADAESARLELFGLAQAVAAQRRAAPGADIVSRMVGHGHGLDDEEVAHQLILIISAAHDPLQNLIANTLHTLLTDATTRGQLAGGRARVEDTVDLVLWRRPPITVMPGRYAVCDMVLGGAQVREGDCLIIGYGPAHADPVVAGALDPAHMSGAQAHLAFGTGPHQCPARHLARLIAIDAVHTVVELLPDMALAVATHDLTWRQSPFAHGLVALPVTFTPTTITVAALSSGALSCPHAPSPSPLSPEMPAPRHASCRPRGRWRAWWSRVWRSGR